MTTRDEPCDAFIGLIVRAADGSLDADGDARLAEHTAGCAACAAALAEQREARAALEAWPETLVTPAFTARVLASIDDLAERERRVPVWDFRRWTWRLAPLAAGLGLAAWLVVGQTAAVLAEPAIEPTTAGRTVSAALWADDVSGDDLVSLMLTAGPDDSLTQALEETPQ